MVEANQDAQGNPTRTVDRLGLFVFIILSVTLILLSIALKVPLLDKPFLGNHLFRQLQTLSTIEAFIRDGIEWLKPRSNYAGYPGFLLLELPLFQVLATWVSKLVGNALVTTKTLNIGFGLLSGIGVYQIGRLFFSRMTAASLLIVYIYAPLNLMYHTSTLIDPMVVSCSVFCAWVMLSRHMGKKSVPGIFVYLICSLVILVTKPLYFFPNALLIIALFLEDFFKKPDTKQIIAYVKEHLWIIVSTAMGGMLMILWISISSKLTTNVDTLSHLSWTQLKNPGTYLTYLFRYLFYIQTPITLLFAVIGITCWKRNPILIAFAIVCAALPFLFYLAFANINRPHDYYSLIMAPYVAILAGCGIEKLFAKKSATQSLQLAGTVTIAVFLSLYLYFTNYWVTPSTTNRYAEISQATEGTLQPFQYTVVWVNRAGNFSKDEFLSESRRDLIAAKLGKLDVEKLRHHIRPIYSPPLLYALNHQYGETIWYFDDFEVSEVAEKIAQYEGNLRYVAVYMHRDTDALKSKINSELVLETENLLVFDLKPSE